MPHRTLCCAVSSAPLLSYTVPHTGLCRVTLQNNIIYNSLGFHCISSEEDNPSDSTKYAYKLSYWWTTLKKLHSIYRSISMAPDYQIQNIKCIISPPHPHHLWNCNQTKNNILFFALILCQILDRKCVSVQCRGLLAGLGVGRQPIWGQKRGGGTVIKIP
jgi:hypothetical protein